MIQMTCQQCGCHYEKQAGRFRKDRKFCSTTCRYESEKLPSPTTGIKFCSKCKRKLILEKFWKSKTQASGYYPSCIECEISHRNQQLENNPMCIRCWISPHIKGNAYCAHCDRIMHSKPPRKRVVRTKGVEWCKICEQLPRQIPHSYCAPCRREYALITRKKKWAERYHTDPMKQRQTARQYATGLLARGKIKRGLCVWCGNKGTDFHHWDYLPKTRNFEDVCRLCHVELHAVIEILLTLIKARAIRFPAD